MSFNSLVLRGEGGFAYWQSKQTLILLILVMNNLPLTLKDLKSSKPQGSGARGREWEEEREGRGNLKGVMEVPLHLFY